MAGWGLRAGWLPASLLCGVAVAGCSSTSEQPPCGITDDRDPRACCIVGTGRRGSADYQEIVYDPSRDLCCGKTERGGTILPSFVVWGGGSPPSGSFDTAISCDAARCDGSSVPPSGSGDIGRRCEGSGSACDDEDPRWWTPVLCCGTTSGFEHYMPPYECCYNEALDTRVVSLVCPATDPDAGFEDTDGPDTGNDADDGASADGGPVADGGADHDASDADASAPTVCNGVPIAPRLACCGTATLGEVYDPLEEICCDPRSAYTAPIGQECAVALERCGGALPPNDDAVCCGDPVAPGTWYDPSIEQCCDEDSGATARIGGNCPASRLCGGELMQAEQACCGTPADGAPFFPAASVCCDRTTADVRPVSDGCERPTCGGFSFNEPFACCGDASFGIAYDPAASQCCDAAAALTAPVGTPCPEPLRCGGEPYSPPADCCGTAIYTPSMQQCCNAATSDVRGRSETCGDVAFYGVWSFATACGGDVYISDLSNGILKANGATGSLSLFAPAGFALGSVCEGDTLLWSDVDNGIFRTPLSGGASTLVVGGPSTAAFDIVRSGTRIAWVRNQTFSDVWVHNFADSTTVTVATNQQLPQHLATDGTWIYYVERSGFSPVVRRVRFDGGSGGVPETVMTELTGTDDAKELLVYDGTLYVAANGTGRIYARPADGTGAVERFAGPDFEPGMPMDELEVRPYAIATDGVRIFWRDEANGRIRARPIDRSTAAATVLQVPGGGTRGDVVVDDVRVYAVDSATHTVVSTPR